MNTALQPPARKIMDSLEDAVMWREKIRREGIRLAVTNGCFDILHRGHAQYLFGARSTADALLVLLNSDSSVKTLKGPTRPVNSQYDRAFLLASLEFVDAVLVFDSPRCVSELAALKPDVYAKGADYSPEKLDPSEREALVSCGAKLEFIELVEGLSTTNILKKRK